MGEDQPEGSQAGIVGYVSSEAADSFGSESEGAIELQFEPGNDRITMRVDAAEVVELRKGGEENGFTRFHVLLRPGAKVDTAVKAFRGVQAIDDPTLSRLTAVAEVSVSFV